MAGRRKKKFEQFVRCFEVTDPTLHEKGHTIYKVTQKLIKVDAPDGDVQEIVVWRRYNDFNKLYKAMLQLHRSLHRREEFPPFARAKVFGRFDGPVLEERMRSAQDLLNFVGQRHYLVANQAFKQFFEGGQKVKHDIGKKVLQPLRLGEINKDSTVTDSESVRSGTSTVDSGEGNREIPESSRDEGEMLGGVWQYRQPPDDISLNEDEDEDDEDTDFTDDSALSTPLPSTDVAFFDPLSSTSTAGESAEALAQYKDSWLLASVPYPQAEADDLTAEDGDTEELKKLQDEFLSCSLDKDCVDLEEDGVADVITGSGDQTSDQSAAPTQSNQSQSPSQSQLDEFDPFKPRSRAGSGSAVACGKGDLSVSPVCDDPASLSPANQSPAHSGSSSGHKPSGKTPPGVSPQQSPQKSKLLSLDLQDKADYIFQAAHQISLAQQCEVNSNYHMAFNYYKKAVGIMLTGVQLDENTTRRDIVRRKTAKYLMKAEELYHKYLAEQEERSNHRWDTGQPSPAKLLDARVAFLQGHISELKNLKVLGVVGKGLLVMDTITDSTFVVKVLRKSCSDSADPQRPNIIPTVSSYMVRLHKFFLTDSAIYLLLQHASGDRLWTYVSGYLHQQQNESHGFLDDRQQDYGWARSPDDSKKTDRTQETRSSSGPQTKTSNVTGPQAATEEIGECATSYASLFNAEQTIGVSQRDTDCPSQPQNTSNSGNKDDTDILSLDSSKEVASFRKAPGDEATAHSSKPSSTSLDVAEVATPLPLPRGRHPSAGQPGFEDLLKDQKPSLEYFSINSFDSDSGPGSRFESTSDYNIESIPEVSECSPIGSPVKDKPSNECSPLREDVFNVDQTEPESARQQDTDSVQDVKRLSVDADSGSNAGCERTADTETGSILNGAKTTEDGAEFASNVTLHSTPCKKPEEICDLSVDSVPGSLDEEPSIYDQFKDTETDRSGGSSPDKPLARSPAEEKAAIIPTNLPLNHATAPVIQLVSSDPIGQATDQSDRLSQSKSPVFRLPSQERSLESPVKPRKRTLSSVFGELDLAEEENREVIRLPEVCVKQWAAELVVGISRLHAVGIICRDLRPDNILLGERGHILLTYFSQWSQVEPQLSQDAVQQLYAAPEVTGVFGVDPCCDWWSLGALLYELLTGKSLASCHPSGITSHTQLFIPDFLTAEAQSLLTGLLCCCPQERLGAGMSGLDDIKLHPFFSGIDWDLLNG